MAISGVPLSGYAGRWWLRHQLNVLLPKVAEACPALSILHGQVPNGLSRARGLARYPMAVLIVGSMIAREPAFELGVAILAPHRVNLLHV